MSFSPRKKLVAPEEIQWSESRALTRTSNSGGQSDPLTTPRVGKSETTTEAAAVGEAGHRLAALEADAESVEAAQRPAREVGRG